MNWAKKAKEYHLTKQGEALQETLVRLATVLLPSSVDEVESDSTNRDSVDM